MEVMPVVVYPIGSTKACAVCARILQKNDISIIDHPSPEVDCLLLDVPAFSADGSLRCGGQIQSYLAMLPESVTVIGGNLKHKDLKNVHCLDLLQDPRYLASNAAITADCAVKIIAPRIDFIFQNSPVLILGWGRIGKCLAQLLRNAGCHVTVAARKEEDRAILEALGYTAVDFAQIPEILQDQKLLFNTVPETVLDTAVPGHCLAVELASGDCIHGENLLTARGLPGKLAPESAGQLMAETILRKHREGLF